jgi:hypothetical protein
MPYRIDRDKNKGRAEARPWKMTCEKKNRLDLILRIRREIQNIGRNSDYKQERDGYQSREHKKLSSLDVRLSALTHIRLSATVEVDTVYT